MTLAERRSDSELVARTLAGDQRAFGELVARYRHAVLGVAFHRVGDFENARDVAQEAFLKAYTGLPKLRKPESFASWLYHIADLTALEVARRPRREVLLPPDEMLTAAPHASDAATSDLAQQVREALAALDEPTRLAVILHYIDGYSHAEVASFLGTTAGAVRTRVSRAKSRIQEEIMSEAEQALKEAVERVLAAVSAQNWQAALDEVKRSGLPPEQYPDLAYGAGLAQTVLGWEPFNPRALSDGANLLLRALESGRGDPTTVWRAVSALKALGEYSRIPPALARYMEQTPDPNERVHAGVVLASTWEILEDHAAAVNAHRAALSGLGERADLAAKLDSYLIAHVALAYAHTGAGQQWLESALRLWEAAPESARTLARTGSLMSSAVSVYRASEGQTARARELALRLADGLLRDPRLGEGEDRVVALRAKGDMYLKLYRSYSVLGFPEKAQVAFDMAKESAEELARKAEAPGPEQAAWREAAFITTANAGVLSRFWGRTHEALALLRKAEQLAAPTSTTGPVLLHLAAAILQIGGDRQEALRYLRRMAEDRPWVNSGGPRQEFGRDPAFESVRDAPEFLAVINGLREAASQEQN
ncbi:MAG: RNA polymerase sigma factor [Armatimonadota bacterium]|nr:MAG: RNA polymerase sigma factor [Armatimonadota bacterium]